jgi:hypothetical protein
MAVLLSNSFWFATSMAWPLAHDQPAFYFILRKKLCALFVFSLSVEDADSITNTRGLTTFQTLEPTYLLLL